MAKYNSSNVTIEFDNAAGALQNITAYVLNNLSLKKKGVFEEATSFGASAVARLYAGMKDTEPIQIECFYDDAASPAPDALFDDIGNVATTGGATRTLKITWGGTKTSSVEMFIQDYEKKTDVGKLHRSVVTLLPSGAVTET